MARQIDKSDWWALALVLVLFVAWRATGCEALRYTVLAVTFGYFLVVRIVLRNWKNK